jgi:hypothetical protein
MLLKMIDPHARVDEHLLVRSSNAQAHQSLRSS